MSTMAVSSASSFRSTLNPNAPLFVPSAFKQVEDFSPKWWELVNTTAWYRDYWFNEHQQLEALEQEQNIESLLPDSIDLDLENDMSLFEAEAEAELEFSRSFEMYNIKPGFDNEREAIIRSLNLNSPRNGGFNQFNRERPMHYVNPKCSPRHFIHQPR
ncbi:hypothetical protein LUZ60_014031 [Juncus effusus]|nr:hypothetical protein LUZ60_014031 [Juncus effusus]